MESIAEKVRQIINDDGMLGLSRNIVAYAYRRGVRPWLPSTGYVHYAGIPTAYDHKWGDDSVPSLWLPHYAMDAPDYESTLISGLKEHVRFGDRVVVVGGGVGVTATVAALQVGPSGSVRCFEAAIESVEKVRRTAALNGVAEWLTVDHAVVGRPISIYGTQPSREVLAPIELPECDVLELDCEGAEVDILQTMSIHPRVILVETHGHYGAPTALVSSLLEERGYHLSCRGAAEPRVRKYCDEHDIQVVIGVLDKEQVY